MRSLAATSAVAATFMAMMVAVPLAEAASGCSGSDSFDYFMLVTQWPPTECESWNFGCSSTASWFTMHGLWPNNFDGSYPCYCTNEPFSEHDVQGFINEMNQYWPSFSNGGNSAFWEHEWTKHGTCAVYNSSIINSQTDFFNTTLALRNSYAPDQVLASAGIRPSNKDKVRTSDVLSALKSGLGASSSITCDSHGLLATATVCISGSLKPMDCPNNVSPSSGCSDELTYPSSTSLARTSLR